MISSEFDSFRSSIDVVIELLDSAVVALLTVDDWYAVVAAEATNITTMDDSPPTSACVLVNDVVARFPMIVDDTRMRFSTLFLAVNILIIFSFHGRCM